MLDDIACLIADAQKEMNENENIFNLRGLAVLVVCLIPIVVCLLGVVAGLLQLRILSCCIAVQLGWLMIIVRVCTHSIQQPICPCMTSCA